jgi:hypothetical protein
MTLDVDRDALTHEGPRHQARYPLERHGPVVQLVKLAEQIALADKMLGVVATARLDVIAGQIRALQQQAREVLDKLQRDQQLHHAAGCFRKVPGQVYHLYRRPDASLQLSLLSPTDWRGRAPHDYLGAYRLELDMSWSELGTVDQVQSTQLD